MNEEMKKKIEKYKISETKQTEVIYRLHDLSLVIPRETATALIDKEFWKREISPHEDGINQIEFFLQVEHDTDYGYGDYDSSCTMEQMVITTVTTALTEEELQKAIDHCEKRAAAEKKKKDAVKKAKATLEAKKKDEELKQLEALAEKYGKKLL